LKINFRLYLKSKADGIAQLDSSYTSLSGADGQGSGPENDIGTNINLIQQLVCLYLSIIKILLFRMVLFKTYIYINIYLFQTGIESGLQQTTAVRFTGFNSGSESLPFSRALAQRLGSNSVHLNNIDINHNVSCYDLIFDVNEWKLSFYT